MAITLSNSDITPTTQAQKTWTSMDFFSLWVGMAICIPTYMMAGSLIQEGMNWKQALAPIFLWNLIVLIPVLLHGHAGAKYGIPFPVFARASFGVLGAHIPVMLRAIVACGWFGIQVWIGGLAIHTICLLIWPHLATFPTVLPEFLGIGLIPLLCFLFFWAVNIWFVSQGMEYVKALQKISAPILICCGVVLLFWALQNAMRIDVVLASTSKFATRTEMLKFFFPALCSVICFWAPLSLNISDFTRYAKDQKTQIIGQSASLPLTMTLFSFIGIAVTSVTIAIYGEAIWDPIKVVQKFGYSSIVLMSMMALVLATLSTNVAANAVGPANDFSNLAPKYIDFRTGGYITGAIGILLMPWKFFTDPSGFIFTWLVGYSALLGPIGGILLTDYFLVRKRNLKVDDLYKLQGAYTYSNGVNLKAIAALIIGILPNLPGFFAQIKLIEPGPVTEFLIPLYHFAWFIGFFLSGLSYLIMMRRQTQIQAMPQLAKVELKKAA